MKNILKNSHIILRAVEPKDVDLLYLWENNSENWQISNTTIPYSKEILRQFVEAPQDIYASKQLRLMITLTNTDQTVGAVDLFNFDPKNQNASIGILIDESFRKNQFAFEALNLLKSYALNVVGIRNLSATILENNMPSLKLFEKCGFELVGVRKKWFNNNGVWLDEHIYQCNLLK